MFDDELYFHFEPVFASTVMCWTSDELLHGGSDTDGQSSSVIESQKTKIQMNAMIDISVWKNAPSIARDVPSHMYGLVMNSSS